MASTLTQLLIHVIFSTRNREALLTADVSKSLYAYVGGICNGNHCKLLAAGGMPDHVHLLIGMSKTIALSDLILRIKRDSSHWIKKHREDFAHFHWQDGYTAFSIGASQIHRLKRYIANQAEHHRRQDFKDELRSFLDRFGIKYDERYVFE